jgi:hypothetical protein
MIIPLWVDENKDKRLIGWLNEQTNRSAFIRFILYEKMEGNVKYIEKSEKIYEKSVEIDDNLINCIENL